jgi:hypothetical protein
MLSTRRKVLACLMPLLMVGLTGCGSLLRQPAPTDRPPPLFEGFSDVRYYPLDRDMPLPSSVDAAYVDDAYEQRPDGSHVYRYLAISGGGSDGAFGDGLLNGWTQTGT